MHAELVLDRPRQRATGTSKGEPQTGAPFRANRGIHFLTSHSISYPPQIGVMDVLEVDFDRRHVAHDGTYLIAYPGTDDPHGWPWGGARRFQFLPISGLHIFEGDQWVKVHDGHRDMVVIGEVLNVYRRTR